MTVEGRYGPIETSVRPTCRLRGCSAPAQGTGDTVASEMCALHADFLEALRRKIGAPRPAYARTRTS